MSELPRNLLDIEFRFVRVIEFGSVRLLMQYRKQYSDGSWTDWAYPPVVDEAIKVVTT